MLDIGINFRQSSGYVTDGPNEIYWLGADDENAGVYPVTRIVTAGWNGAIGRGDQNAGNDRRLAGRNKSLDLDIFFRVDLPYAMRAAVHLALGDPSGDHSAGVSCEIYDDTALLDTIPFNANVAQRFTDTTGVELTEVTWPTTEAAVEYDFTTTIFKLKFPIDEFEGWSLAHLRIVEVVGKRFFLIPN